MKVYYFGCLGQPGHYMYRENLDRDWDFCESNPWGFAVDGGLCPKGRQIEGQALLHQKDGWTALSFWDRRGDSRPGSCSTFLAEGSFDFDQMLVVAKEKFPSVFLRSTFEIVKA